MKKQPIEVFETTLTAEAIEECSSRIQEFVNKLKTDRKKTMRYALSVEEILLKQMEKTGGGEKIRLTTGTRFFHEFIDLEIYGPAFNVYGHQESEDGVLGGELLKNIGISPEYVYKLEVNRYSFKLKRKKANPFLVLIIALIAAVIVGLLGQFVPEATRLTVVDAVLVPLNDVFLNILGCIAGPMIFLSVAWGIYGIGDAATFKKIGKHLIFNYLITVFALITILALIFTPLYTLNYSGAASGTSAASDVFNMLLGIVPSNIFSPFIEGNTLQIIFIAVVVGIAMLFLGQKTNFVATIVEQINHIVNFLIEIISRLVPYFIFIVLVKMFWSDMASVFSGIGMLFIMFILAVLVMTALMVSFTGIFNRVNPLLLLRKCLPTWVIALTTASSAAAFGTNMKICQESLGIDKKICSFGIPLGIVTFKPTTAVNYMTVSLFFAQLYHVDVSASWIVTMVIITAILSIATPPIPGGAMASYTVLFAQLGIPAEALAVALACDAIFDFVDTGFDQYLMPWAMLNNAGRMGLVHREILLSKTLKKEEAS